MLLTEEDNKSLLRIYDLGKVENLPAGLRIAPTAALSPDTSVDGPAVILDAVATTWLAPAWGASADQLGNLRLELREKP